MYQAQQASVRRALLSGGITAVSEEWLSACLAFLDESCGEMRFPPAALQQQVMRQWLDTDLAVIGVAVLPPQLPDHPVTTVRGPLALQLLDCVDVGQPAHGQLLKLRRLDTANTQVGEPSTAGWEPKPSRALRLTLTDGVLSVVGLEYRPIAALRPDLPPGIKLLLKGEVECRRGVLLLTPDTLEVLGGSVDDLLEPQHEQRALERRLGDAAAAVPPARNDEAVFLPQRQVNANGVPAAVGRQDNFRDYPQRAHTNQGDAAFAANDDLFDDGIDDAELAAVSFEDDIDDAELAELFVADFETAGEPAVPQPVKRPLQETWQPPPPRTNVNVVAQRNETRNIIPTSTKRDKVAPRQQRLDEFIRPSQVVRPPPMAAVPPWSERTSTGDATSRAAPVIKQEPIDKLTVTTNATHRSSIHQPPSSSDGPPVWQRHPEDHQRMPLTSVKPPPPIDPSPWSNVTNDPQSLTSLPEMPSEPAPFQYLSDLQPGGVVTAKVFIMTQTSKLSMAGGQWSLAVKVNDGCSALEATISDAVLTKLIGLSVADVGRLKGQPGARETMKRALDTAQDVIIHLNSLVRVEMTAAGAATITEVQDITADTVHQLQRAMSAS